MFLDYQEVLEDARIWGFVMVEETAERPNFRFTLEEISGSFGDSITVIPLSAPGALLVFIALELGLAASRTDKWHITLIIGFVSLFTNIAVGFGVGLGLEKAMGFWSEGD